VRHLKDVTMKQEKELLKKDEQIDALLEQLKYLKNMVADGRVKKHSK
jgi:hypothetical protein